jgi:hypothetical protein
MKKIKNYSKLRKYSNRVLRRILERRRLNRKFRNVWFPKTPYIQNDERPRAKKDWVKFAAHLHPPTDLVLFQSPESVISFFDQVSQAHAQNKDVFLHLEDVQNITSDTILLMISRLHDERFNHRKKVGGFSPQNEKARTVFEESGVYGDRVFDLTSIRARKGSIKRHNNYFVDADIIDHLLTHAEKYFASEEQSAATYDLLLELMNNTIMHAGGRKSKELWWCSVYCMPDKALFNFLDNGLGICETAAQRLTRKLVSFLGLTTNEKLLEDIMLDTVESSTGKYYHGRGLPLIRRRTQKKLIDNVTIITNDVFANISTGEYRLMNTSFKGTFVHWEVPLVDSNTAIA